MQYEPPFNINNNITNHLAEIAENVGLITAKIGEVPQLKLRKENRIKSIQSSLAIENNSLTVEQITAILNGKKILGSPKEIQEVKNDFEAYDLLMKLNPFSEKDFLLAHQILMKDLIKENGKYRSKGIGISDGKNIIHIAPPADRMPYLIKDLLSWLEISELHSLIKSCIFHYELEFIHPFSYGNGRMGRLWQTLILSQWKPFFSWIPVETIVKENQAEYYDALKNSDQKADSAPFVEFMLDCISKSIKEISTHQNVGINVGINEAEILELIKEYPKITAKEMSEKLIITSRQTERLLANLKKKKLIERIGSRKSGEWKIIS